MNKSMLAGIGIGVAAALGVAAVASLNVFERGPQYAHVVSATPIKETVKTPRQECRNVTVTHRKPVQDENRIAGSVLGAVAGGVVGLVSSVGLTLVSASVWEAVLHNPKGSALFPYSSPALFSMTAAFLTIYLVSKMDNSKQAQLERLLYPAQKVRSETGLGAVTSSGH